MFQHQSPKDTGFESFSVAGGLIALQVPSLFLRFIKSHPFGIRFVVSLFWSSPLGSFFLGGTMHASFLDQRPDTRGFLRPVEPAELLVRTAPPPAEVDAVHPRNDALLLQHFQGPFFRIGVHHQHSSTIGHFCGFRSDHVGPMSFQEVPYVHQNIPNNSKKHCQNGPDILFKHPKQKHDIALPKSILVISTPWIEIEPSKARI